MQAGRTTHIGRVVLAAVTMLSVSLMAGEQQAAPQTPPHEMKMSGMSTMTKAEKIANAMTAGPASIAGTATVLDWPAKDGEQPTTIRPGSNGWFCLPDMPDTNGNDPMCLDEPWMKWVQAYTTKTTPAVGRVGVGYMTAPGGAWGSNTDPYGMTQTATNHWGFHPPHVMIVVPDPRSLEGISTDPNNGGPYVMYAGTPYAHIMAPTMAASMTHK